MVSLWPWKGEDNSPASFEKTLSALATKTSKSQSQLDSLRLRSRRLNGLWTIYTSFAYLLIVIILFLVVGWKNWGALEYTTVAGSPLVIYLIRTGITAYYNYRVNNVTQRLEAQQAERAKTIDKLKAATKYNSTQELLEKYGGAPPKPKKQVAQSKSPKPSQNQPQRTSMGPPPATANVPRPNQVPSQPSTPQPVSRSPSSYIAPSSVSVQAQALPGPPEFAPNAFSAPPQYAQGGEFNASGHWYDRVLDLLLGEDETSPRNRMALICQNCRLVNGQAPPGTKTLADLGRWRCFGCGSWNGEEDEAVKVVQEMKKRIEPSGPDQSSPGNEGSENAETRAGKDEEDDGAKDADADDREDADSAEELIEVKPRRGRSKGSRKKA